MITSPQFTDLTSDEYLVREEQSDTKHEYIDGHIYRMAGANDAHVTISGNLFAVLRNHVRGSGCRVYQSDMKARIGLLNRFYYPDVMVTCDPRDRETPIYKQFPCLIVEVLSSSTEVFDRGDKFADYQQLSSLQEYVLINTKRQRVECFRRNGEGLWVLQYYGPEQLYGSDRPFFALKSIGLTMAIADLYEDVEFSEVDEVLIKANSI